MPEPEPNPDLNPAGVVVGPLASSPVLVPSTDGPKGHISPACCCVPCEPPEVTCRIEVRYSGNVVVWTAFRSAETWIIKACSGGARTRIDLTGESGELPFDSDCTYTIYGVNACGQVQHTCEQCDVPICNIGQTIDTIEDDDRRTLNWQVARGVGESPIVRITIDGVDEPTPDPNQLNFGGLIQVLCQGNPNTEVCVEAENECGQIVECCWPIPCEWQKSRMVVELRNLAAQYARNVPADSPLGDPPYSLYHEYELNGLDGANGTHVIFPDDCVYPEYSDEFALATDGWFEYKVLNILNYLITTRITFSSDTARLGYQMDASGLRCVNLNVKVTSYTVYSETYDLFGNFIGSTTVEQFPSQIWYLAVGGGSCDIDKEICESIPPWEERVVFFPIQGAGPTGAYCFGSSGKVTGPSCVSYVCEARHYLDV